MSEVAELLPIYVCDCVDGRDEYVGPVIFPNPATGDKEWKCTACFKKPLFRGWTPAPEPPQYTGGDGA